MDFDYVTIPIRFPDELVDTLHADQLPDDWNGWPWPHSPKSLGSAWFDEQASAVLKVPSAVVPAHSNYLINPRHPDFDVLTAGEPRPFPIDTRLIGE